MDKNTKIILGVGAVGLIGWYLMTRPKVATPAVAYKVVTPALPVNATAQDIAAGAAAATAAAALVTSISDAASNASTDDSGLDDSSDSYSQSYLSGMPQYAGSLP